MEDKNKTQNKFLSRTSALIIAGILLLTAGLGLFLYKSNWSNKASNTQNTTANTQPQAEKLKVEAINEKGETSNYEVNLKEGETAFEALKRLDTESDKFQISYKEYSFGAMITSINGYEPDASKQFWKFQVNGKDSDTGISAYKVQKGDTLKFSLDDIKY